LSPLEHGRRHDRIVEESDFVLLMVMELSLRSHDPAHIPNFVDMTKDANSISATNIIWPLWKVGDVEVSKMMYSRTLAFPESRRATTARANTDEESPSTFRGSLQTQPEASPNPNISFGSPAASPHRPLRYHGARRSFKGEKIASASMPPFTPPEHWHFLTP
jgi:hypothetical protein